VIHTLVSAHQAAGHDARCDLNQHTADETLSVSMMAVSASAALSQQRDAALLCSSPVFTTLLCSEVANESKTTVKHAKVTRSTRTVVGGSVSEFCWAFIAPPTCSLPGWHPPVPPPASQLYIHQKLIKYLALN